MEGLKASMLVVNNIIDIKEILINIHNTFALNISYAVTIFIYIKQGDNFILCKILLAIATTLSLHSADLVTIHHPSLSNNQDFFFSPTAYSILNIHTHLLDLTNTKVVILNNSNQNVRLTKK